MYDAAPALTWQIPAQRVLLKAVARFTQAHGMPLLDLRLPDAGARAGLLLPDVIRHPSAAPLNVVTLLEQHCGLEEIDAADQ
ncbi:hypothetical protein [Deinococcus sp. 6GRE01]|uniref:hypothetical protein n=1 Tax=Deinococcus sp. 6GRE01 TaxID=2745873 RepID=UPI001E63BC3F|nr:hypothetical protein [Deinococcus sp. 6GRE01]MCD0155934.1 hypothetical protein [Deinococcus sp. 6GRE01]